MEHRITTLVSKIQLSGINSHKVPETNAHHHIHNWHSETLNRMRYGQLCITFSYEKQDGFTIKDLVYDLRISDVAVRDMVAYSLKQEWLQKNLETNRHKVTAYALEQNFKYTNWHMEKAQKLISELNSLLTVYNQASYDGKPYFDPTRFKENSK
ncbi:MAG: hypothetical protein CBC02_001340 [Flavobacteriaceae bacterium TMED42]|nr:MAG: hypothetical protein CBC02_001340 [Flavobacteriaceae bacterium TMED42]|tara:strand:+ start:2337 stop:2798 length:462 start_codon:yes stop_codon:yes gene_type:complete